MHTVDQWKALLRARLRAALRGDRRVVAVLRETLAAIENAEAPPVTSLGSVDGPFAMSVPGAGASDVERLVLTPEQVRAIVERELRERREAAEEYTRLGREDAAAGLRLQADALAAIAAEADS